MTLQLVVESLGLIVDILIVVFFAIEVKGIEAQRQLMTKQLEVWDELRKLLTTKTDQQIEILEDVHAELADIADNTPEILTEGQDEPYTDRNDQRPQDR